MSHQIRATDKVERLEQEKRWRSKWARWARRQPIRSAWDIWADCLRQAREEAAAAARAAEAAEWAAHASATMAPDSDSELAAATALGVDVATYRLLIELERREISPEDYDLLGRLDEPVRPTTLRPEQLKRFPSEAYVAESLGQFGVDFWRLPLSTDIDEVSTDHGSGTSAVSTCSDSDVCAICCMEFVSGDIVRRLQPCGHCFHRDCIDRWLLESSNCCPVDKQELCC